MSAVFSDASEESEGSISGFAPTIRLHSAATKPERDPRMIYIDSLADHAFTNNKDLATNWRNHEFKIESVTGKDRGSLMGTLPCFGDVAYTPRSGVSARPMATIENYPYKIESRKRWTADICPTLSLVFMYNKDHKAYVFSNEVIGEAYH